MIPNKNFDPTQQSECEVEPENDIKNILSDVSKQKQLTDKNFFDSGVFTLFTKRSMDLIFPGNDNKLFYDDCVEA